ncbi:MAG: 30S ribosomal protein S6 [Planctomycetaceae bacterium]|nr:30S ribosomal protein S6 [Planctomycetaceae bacterium]
MFLVDSNQFANDPDATVAAIMAILDRAGATVVAHRPWQDGKLAYEINGHRKGLHYLVCFRMLGAGMDVVTRQCHLSDVVIRNMVIRHTPELFNAVVEAISGSVEESGEDSEASSEESEG